MDNARQIVIHITGLPEDNGDIKFGEFVHQLQLVTKALYETQRLISNDAEVAYFKVTQLQKHSPAQIVVEAVPLTNQSEDIASQLVNCFFQGITAIEKGEWPEKFTESVFEAYKELPSLKEKKRVANIEFSRNGGEKYQIDNLSKNIDILLGPDDLEYGSYTGMLDAINIHNQNIFYIYPTYLFPKLKCHFAANLKRESILAVGKYVTVYGIKKIRSKLHTGIPYQMNVDRIEIHPSPDELPNLRDLKGTITPAIDDVLSEDFVRGLRDEW